MKAFHTNLHNTNANNFSNNDLLNSNSFTPKSTQNFNTNLNFFTSSLNQSKNFINREEFHELHLKREALDQKIKFRKEFEYTYNHLKRNELDKDIEDLKFKNSIAHKRNEDLLNSIQNDILKCHQISKISENSKRLLETEKNKYKNYLSYQLNNIRKDFQQKLLAKQNEMQGIQKVMESRLKKNEEVLRIENEYTNRISKMNEEFMNSIRILQEKNKKIEEERKSVIKNYSVVEEKTKDEFSNIIENRDTKKNEVSTRGEKENSENFINDQNKTNNINEDNKNSEQIYINKSICFDSKEKNVNSKSNLDEKQNLNRSNSRSIPITPDKKIADNSQEKNEPIHKQRKTSDDTKSLNINKQKDESKEYSNKGNINNVSKQSEDATKHLHTRKSGILGAIRRKKQEADKEEKRSNANLNSSLNKEIKHEKTTLYNNSISYCENVEESKISNQNNFNKNTKTSTSKRNNHQGHLQDEEIEDSFISDIEKNVNVNGSIEKHIENQKNPVSNTNGKTFPNNEMIQQNQSIIMQQNILIDKPDLTQVNIKYKLKVLYKLLPHIEKIAKLIKPNNPSTYLIQTKHMNLNSNYNKESIHTKFYEILEKISEEESKNNNNNLEIFFSSLTNDLSIFILLSLLNSNKNLNLNPENLKQTEYNEQIFENDMNKDAKEIFEKILSVVKKLILDKKTSPNIAANVLANSLMNFEKDSKMTSNLIVVLERKLFHKNVQNIAGWGGFQFNQMNMSNSNGFRSFVSIPKKDLAVNNSNVKESGLFNDFKEIE